ncbi:hypothetical protein L914_08632 [Phytophthora nicotianae]|uniref:Uncharacterized protein n=1 Tax=Phytophthora nicotianae TaxID=4792 RepID=W2NCY5_PHYNI|nr:hypothetical protein L914_08632 [Phytophthora nicotianae]
MVARQGFSPWAAVQLLDVGFSAIAAGPAVCSGGWFSSASLASGVSTGGERAHFQDANALDSPSGLLLNSSCAFRDPDGRSQHDLPASSCSPGMLESSREPGVFGFAHTQRLYQARYRSFLILIPAA